MKANNLDLMKLAQAFDGEFNLSDFSPEELDEFLGLVGTDTSPDEIRKKYFEFYDDIKDRTLPKHKWSD